MLELRHQGYFLMSPRVVVPGNLVRTLETAPVFLRVFPEEELRVTMIGTRFECSHFTSFQEVLWGIFPLPIKRKPPGSRSPPREKKTFLLFFIIDITHFCMSE